MHLTLKVQDGEIIASEFHNQQLDADMMRQRGDWLVTLALQLYAEAAKTDASDDDLIGMVFVRRSGLVGTRVNEEVETQGQREWLRRSLDFGVAQACEP